MIGIRFRIFRRWADETDLLEMREAFLSMANSITHRLVCWEQPRIGVVLRNSSSSSIAAPTQGSPRRGVERQ